MPKSITIVPEVTDKAAVSAFRKLAARGRDLPLAAGADVFKAELVAAIVPGDYVVTMDHGTYDIVVASPKDMAKRKAESEKLLSEWPDLRRPKISVAHVHKTR